MELNSYIEADSSLCIGCKLCEVACALEHMPDGGGTTAGNLKHQLRPRLWLVKYANLAKPIHCHHCEDAPCANVCPTQAIEHRDNAVLVNTEKCVGCKQCILECPFGAISLTNEYTPSRLITDEEERSYTQQRIVAAKCDLCKESGGIPACVEVCPKKALRLVNPEEILHDNAMNAASRIIASLKAKKGHDNE